MIRRVWRTAAGSDTVAACLVIATTSVAFGLGLALLLDPAVPFARTFRVAFTWAPPRTWALIFFACGAALAAAAWRGRYHRAQLPALAAAIVLGLWAIFAGFSIADGGVSTGLVAYLGLSALSVITSLACNQHPPAPSDRSPT